ncbi:MAG: helix-turn-helix domain-containing protein [Deltaproteobacteria bacterium]|nr:helix-turn-helix domain-containing protein [Deltaproteobacteria bacterium]
MRAKRFKVKIQNFDQTGQEFVKAWKMAEKGKDYEAGYDLVLAFPDLSWISKVLSPERVRIIQAIRDKKPESIRQLAKLLNRAQQNVQKDVQELAQLGIIELKKARKKGQKRESLQPEYNWDGFDIAV